MHRPLWDGVIQSLQDIFVGGYPADKVIQRQLKGQRKWGSKDRRLFAESVYEIVRWWRRLIATAELTWPSSGTFESFTKADYEKILSCWMALNGVPPGKGIAPNVPKNIQTHWNEPALPRAIRESVPDWLDQLGFQQFGAEWENTLRFMNESAPVFLRANLLKTSPEKLVKQLELEQVIAHHIGDQALVLDKRMNVFTTKAFQQGLFEVQDVNSQKVAPALDVEPGMRVIDACAGGGGKSLHLASLLKNKGRIIAMDVYEKKLGQLRERASRAGVTLIETRLIDSSKVIKRLEDSADALLLDVPCSGLGVVRRNPDAKWKLKFEEISRLQDLQLDILSRYSKMVRKGGAIVYATCSILPTENRSIVDRFLEASEGAYSLRRDSNLMGESGGDGFYIARLQREN